MFDIFATILSAGVVITVVTLVVHEPLLLAAGISTILGLMFLLLPAFVAMVPVLGYLLIFSGVVLLGYGVLSTRSWLNTLQARREAALARRRSLYAARGKEDDDSDLRRASQMTSLSSVVAAAAGPRPGTGAGAGAGRPGNGRDDGPWEAAPPARGPDSSPLARPRSKDGGGRNGAALARLGRGLSRPTGPREEREVGPAPGPALPARWDEPPERFSDSGERFVRPAEPPPLPPPPPPPARPAPIAKAAEPLPPPLSRPPPHKPLSRGAERMERVKEESRRLVPPRRRAAAVRPSEQPAPPAPAPLSLPPAPSPSPSPVPAAGNNRQRRERDLLELGMLDLEPESGSEPETKKDDPKAPARPFVSRLARRT